MSLFVNSQVDVRSHSFAKPLRKARADFTLNKLLTASDQGTTVEHVSSTESGLQSQTCV